MSVAAAEFDRAISRPRQLEIDPLLTFAVATLLLLGVVMVASASMSVAEREFGSAFFYLQRHAAHLVVGLLLGHLDKTFTVQNTPPRIRTAYHLRGTST